MGRESSAPPDPSARRQVGRSGLRVTALGFGGAHLGELFQKIPESEAQATIAAAWDAGLRYFDTSPWYGHGLSEHRLGHRLRQGPRGDFAISTKVGRVYDRPRGSPLVDTRPWAGGLPFVLRFDYSHDGVMRSYEQSLLRLGLNRVDMLLVHDLDAGYHGADGVAARLDELDKGGGFRALAELKAAGEIQAIGAGINDEAMIPRFLERLDLDAFLVAMPYTLLDQRALDAAFPLCAERGVGIVIGAPLASGILATGAVPGARYAYAEASAEILDKVRRIETVCARHAVPLLAAALQFPLHHPLVAAIIPGAVSPEQVLSNVAALRQPIPADLWAVLKAEGLLRADAPVPLAV
jgi:D-threo-aldose 1-dehydrogenase